MTARLLPALAAALWSAAAAAQIDNSALECGTSATYFPRGDHWPMGGSDTPAGTGVTVRYQQNGADGITAGAAQTAIQNAFNAWTGTTSPCSPNIDITRGADYATRDRGDSYVCTSGGACNSACTAGCNLQAYNNIAYFVNTTTAWANIADSQTLALTTNLFIPDTGYTVTSDMEFNDAYFNWRVSGSGCAASSTTCYDVFTVALHEVGHFLGFNHVQCADAVMYPSGTNTMTRSGLTSHETTGLCTIYRARAAVTNKDTMEQCTTNSECPAAHICVKPEGHNLATSLWGWCARSGCTTNANCGAGFICATAAGTQGRYCKPGVNNTGQTGDTTNNNGTSLDLCAPCSEGEQCASGVCVNDGAGTSICTQTCTAQVAGSSAGACPTGMSCQPTDANVSVCWPTLPGSCGDAGFRADLNDLCYSGATSEFTPCGPDLICFGFVPRCGVGQDGVCMLYCNGQRSGGTCPQGATCCPDGNLTCCYGVDDFGNCIATPTQDIPHGGCFDIRRPGEACVLGEQSVCEAGSGCFFFVEEGVQHARCYRRCESNSCATNEDCMLYADGCNNQFALCCDADLPNTCSPTDEVVYYDIGIECTSSSECNSGLCQHLDGQSACSRWCNWTTEYGCPTDLDLTGDGAPEEFVCRYVNGEGRCWPRNGPVPPPSEEPAPPPTGCCSATAVKPGDWFLAALLWVPFLWLTRRRRA